MPVVQKGALRAARAHNQADGNGEITPYPWYIRTMMIGGGDAFEPLMLPPHVRYRGEPDSSGVSRNRRD